MFEYREKYNLEYVFYSNTSARINSNNLSTLYQIYFQVVLGRRRIATTLVKAVTTAVTSMAVTNTSDKRTGLGQPLFINCRIRPFSPVTPKLHHSSLPKIVIIGTTSACVEVRRDVH